MSPTLRNSLLKLRTEKLDALQLKQVQLESYEYLEAEGLLDKAPDVKSLLAAVRKSLSQNNSIDAAAIEKEEAFSSHEGIFMSTSLRDVMLEKFEGLDDEARRTIGSWDSWDSCFAAVADAGPATEIHCLLTSAQSSIIQPGLKALTQSNLTELPQHDQASHSKAMDYIKISPLLTIMLRAHSVWYDDESFAASNKTGCSRANVCSSMPKLAFCLSSCTHRSLGFSKVRSGYRILQPCFRRGNQ